MPFVVTYLPVVTVDFRQNLTSLLWQDKMVMNSSEYQKGSNRDPVHCRDEQDFARLQLPPE